MTGEDAFEAQATWRNRQRLNQSVANIVAIRVAHRAARAGIAVMYYTTSVLPVAVQHVVKCARTVAAQEVFESYG